MASYVQAVHVQDSSERLSLSLPPSLSLSLSLSVYIYILYTYVYTNAHMDSQKSENK